METIEINVKIAINIWFKDGRIHRENGPAVEYPNGHKEWFYYGRQIDCKDNEEFLRIIKHKVFW